MMKIIEIVVLVSWVISCGVLAWMWFTGRLKKNDAQAHVIETALNAELTAGTITGTGTITTPNISGEQSRQSFADMMAEQSVRLRLQRRFQYNQSPEAAQDLDAIIDEINRLGGTEINKEEPKLKKPKGKPHSKFNLGGDT